MASSPNPALSRFVFERLSAVVQTQTAVAISRRTGVSQATLSNILTGRGKCGVGHRVAEKLLPVLGVRSYEALLAQAYAAGAPRADVDEQLGELVRGQGKRKRLEILACAAVTAGLYDRAAALLDELRAMKGDIE